MQNLLGAGYHDLGDDFVHITNLRVRDTTLDNVLSLQKEVAGLGERRSELTDRTEAFPG